MTQNEAAERREQAATLRAIGLSWAEVGKALGISARAAMGLGLSEDVRHVLEASPMAPSARGGPRPPKDT